MSPARPRPAEGSPSPRRSSWLGRAIRLRRSRGNPEGTPARAPESTGGHSSSGDSFFLRDFRARGFPALPAVPASLLDGNGGGHQRDTASWLLALTDASEATEPPWSGGAPSWVARKPPERRSARLASDQDVGTNVRMFV